MEVDLVTTATDADAEELWPVYAEVFEETRDLAGWRAGTWDRHAARAGFRLARLRQGGELVGLAYGLTGEHGQWWTDRVAAVWPDAPRRQRGWAATSSSCRSAFVRRHGDGEQAACCSTPSPPTCRTTAGS